MQHDGWRIDVVDGMKVIRCDALMLPGVGHAFSTRVGPDGEELDLGAHDSDGPEFDRRRSAFCNAAGLEGSRPTILRQIHGAAIVRLDGERSVDGLEADAVIAAVEGHGSFVPAVRWADCVGVLLCDSGARAIAAVHGGWRGIAAGVVPRSVAALQEIGVAAGSILAAIGPSIGPCCYEVSADVIDAVARAVPTQPGTLVRSPRGLDLRRAVRLQLERAGLPPGSIHEAPWCTSCSRELFFSYRRDGGPTGRQMACIGWSAGSSA